MLVFAQETREDIPFSAPQVYAKASWNLLKFFNEEETLPIMLPRLGTIFYVPFGA